MTAAEHDQRRRQLAELALLERYDAMRQAAGHDYGNGQRNAELARRRRELEPTEAELESLTAEELAGAYARVGRPRLARAEADSARAFGPGRHTPTAFARGSASSAASSSPPPAAASAPPCSSPRR